MTASSNSAGGALPVGPFSRSRGGTPNLFKNSYSRKRKKVEKKNILMARQTRIKPSKIMVVFDRDLCLTSRICERERVVTRRN
jgi:hypothetical protein